MKKVRCDKCFGSKEKIQFPYLQDIDFVSEFGAVCQDCLTRHLFVLNGDFRTFEPGDIFNVSGFGTFVFMDHKSRNECFASMLEG